MSRFLSAMLGVLVVMAPIASDPSRRLLITVLETDSGVGGGAPNQFVFLRVFSDRTVEFHSKRNQDIKREPVKVTQLSETDTQNILMLLAREDVKKLPRTFESPYTPIDFSWTLDFAIPRGTTSQQIHLVNFSPAKSKEYNKPYPEALLRLACTVLGVRQDFQAQTPDLRNVCNDFVLKNDGTGSIRD